MIGYVVGRYVAPEGIAAPAVDVVQDTTLRFTWHAPGLYTGPLTRYVLTAYNVDDVTVLPVSNTVIPPLTTGRYSAFYYKKSKVHHTPLRERRRVLISLS